MTMGNSANTEMSVRQQAYHCQEPLKQTNKEMIENSQENAGL